MKIKKRDGTLVEFNKDKIITAVSKAMSETKDGIDEELAAKVATLVLSETKENDGVEVIQDRIEKHLMQLSPATAKRYIIYRITREKERGKTPKYKMFDDEFLSKYKHMPSPMDELGNFVYYRTYSRYLPDLGRREYWWETCARAVDYNCSLVPSTTQDEAKVLYDNMFHLRQFLSGRTLWTGGTEVSKLYPMSNFNCFRQDTEFLTKYGIQQFGWLQDGEEIEVLNANGAWAKATVHNFGKQELVKLRLQRKGTKYYEDVYTTANHKWFVKIPNDTHYKITETADLSKGDALRTKRRYEHTNLNMCPTAIQHGIVYGDGTFDKVKGHCRVSLLGDKQSYLKYFAGYTSCSEGNRDSTLVYGLPYYYKKLPSLNANPEYIKGFLYGLLLTDGAIGTSVRIGQKDLSTIQQLQSMCEIIGLTTSKITEWVRSNKNFGEYDNMYGFTIHKETLYKHEMFVEATEESNQLDWVVDSIEFTGEIEDVWCVVEPITNTFTLRGGILTHNCAFQVIDDITAFHDLLYLLMIGSGVGVRITEEDVDKLPNFRNDYELAFDIYMPMSKANRREGTIVSFREDCAHIMVGDSKNGWSDAMRWFMTIVTHERYEHIKRIAINFNSVRPAGEKLKTFGGTASGHDALLNVFKKIDKVFRNKEENSSFKLKPIDCMDICNIIGEGVVVGGVRRTAEIILFEPKDKECIDAKSSLYTEVNGEWIVNQELMHRSMSNNSIYFESKPERAELRQLLEKMRYSGEPGFVNAEAASKRRENFKGVNPCAEILLDSRGMCNLTTVNVMAFVDGKYLDVEALIDAQALSARAGYRMTMVELELPKWDVVQQRDKLIGCSLTGWQDMVNATKMPMEDQRYLLEVLRGVAIMAAEEYADYLKQEKPLLVTTVKPEGTLSQLPVVSSGVHYSHSPYYIRRIRVNAHDPIVKVCEELGYPVLPEVGQEWDTCKTKVVEFPVKAPQGVTKNDVSALQQLENYKMFMEAYVDHNCSITVHVRDHEWDLVEEWLWENWDDTVAVSFISLDDNFYNLLPYEEITEDQFMERKANMAPFVPALISKYETDEVVELIEDACASGACPIR